MKKLINQFKYGQKGFTLIELLVVVAILGILAAVAILGVLAAVAIPNVAKFVNSGDLAAANTELANVQTAQAAWMADHQNVPTTSLTDLATFSNKAFTGAYTFETSNVDKLGQVTAGSYPASSPKYTLNTTTMQFTAAAP